MANCKVQFGVSLVCGDLLRSSGVDKDFYVGYISDLGTRFDLTQTGSISSIHFAAYNGLVKFEGQKFSHKFDWELQKAAGGTLSYLHRAIVKMLPLSTRDDVEVQRLTQAQDAFIVFQDNNSDFFIVGAGKGLTAIAGAIGTTGQAQGEDISSTITLEGSEKTLFLRFSAGTVTQTVNLLNSYVV